MKWQPALGLNCYIPILIFLTNKFLRSKRTLWKALLFIQTCATFLIHPYHGVMQCCFLLIIFLLAKDRINNKLLRIISFSILPVFCFLAFLKISDLHFNRVSNPDGILKFSSNGQSILLSVFSPLKIFYKKLFGQDFTWLFNFFEGWAYIGISGIIFIILISFLAVTDYKGISKTILHLPRSLKLTLITSFIMLFISTALPFKLIDISKEVLNLIPPLRQFRALGRFAWFFVFALHLSLGYIISIKWIEKKEKKYLMIFLVLFSTTIWEGINQHIFAAKDITTNILRKPHSAIDKLNQEGINIEDLSIQALVPIPYFHVGSHRFHTKISTPYSYLNEFLPFALQSNLPVTASLLSRNSIDESILSFSFFSDEVFNKPILDEFNDNSLLLFHDKRFRMSQEEKSILDNSLIIYEDQEIKLSILEPGQLKVNKAKDKYEYFNINRNYFQKTNDIFIEDSLKHQLTRFGLDTLHMGLGRDNSVKIFSGDGADMPEGNYIISFWFNHTEGRSNVRLYMDAHDKIMNDLVEIGEIEDGLRSFNIFGDYMLCEIEFEYRKKMEVSFYFESLFDQHIENVILNNLIIYPKGANIFHKREERWYWNNKPLEF